MHAAATRKEKKEKLGQIFITQPSAVPAFQGNTHCTRQHLHCKDIYTVIDADSTPIPQFSLGLYRYKSEPQPVLPDTHEGVQ